MNQKIKAPFSIGAASTMTGITRKRIRSWEARNYISRATRVVCGERAYRYFTPKQIETIRKIKMITKRLITTAIVMASVEFAYRESLFHGTRFL